MTPIIVPIGMATPGRFDDRGSLEPTSRHGEEVGGGHNSVSSHKEETPHFPSLPRRVVAALFVAKDGVYYGLEDVEPYDQQRDARKYAGPHSVVAHPPCERYGRYATGGPNPLARRREIGDDDGCFASAISSVRTYGGVLEHPAASHAWSRFGLAAPPPSRRVGHG